MHTDVRQTRLEVHPLSVATAWPIDTSAEQYLHAIPSASSRCAYVQQSRQTTGRCHCENCESRA